MENLPQKNNDSFDVVESYEPSLGDHIRELRKRIIWCLVTLVVVFFGLASFVSEPLMKIITKPITDRGIQLIYIGLAEALTAQLKVCFIAAFVISSPVFLWHIWDFVKPALYDNEKKAVLIFTFGSVVLFLIGVTFGYIVVFLSAITFFVYVGENLATPMLSISQYVGFLFGFVISFGMVFEMPVVSYVLCKMGVVTVDFLKSARKYVILGIFVVAAFLTPPDALSQVLMALPMIVLYEIGIIVAKIGCK
ncbi:MAG: twin-arginine translocase subunit TatC [Phascolarctobacterium sp.]|nr:twin-arginine translocase subunit TatC [Phascolarctobacterium sp.]